MPEQWTADVIGEMHLNGITAKQLAECLGYNSKYVSTVLNGHRKPKKAEEIFRMALDELIRQERRTT